MRVPSASERLNEHGAASMTIQGSWTRSASLAVIVGLIVGAGIALTPTQILPRIEGSSPPGAPSFGFVVYLSNSTELDGAYVYNFTLSYMHGANITTNWTQFYAYSASTYLQVNFTLDLIDRSGMEGFYNSSRSSFEGDREGYNATSFAKLGGWVWGLGVPVVVGDSFAVQSPVTLSGDVVEFSMAVPAPFFIITTDYLSA